MANVARKRQKSGPFSLCRVCGCGIDVRQGPGFELASAVDVSASGSIKASRRTDLRGTAGSRHYASGTLLDGISTRNALNGCGFVILWLFIVIAGVTLLNAMGRDHRDRHEDFAVYYFAGRALRERRNPYSANIARLAQAGGADTHDISHSSDPPTYLLLFEPLSALSLGSAYWIWQALNFACLAAALFLLIVMDGKLDPALGATIAGLALLYPPVGVHFWMGQGKLPVLLLLALMMHWMAHGHEAAAGLALASATLLRVFPIVMIGYLVVQRRWRVAAYTGAGLAMGIAFTLKLIGVADSESFIRSLTFLTGHWWEHDISLRCFVAIAIWTVYPHPALIAEIVRYAITGAVNLAVVVMTVWATMLYREEDDPGWRVFSLWIATAVFLLPVAWDYDLTLMLIPFVRIACAAGRFGASRRTLVMAAISFVLVLVWEFVRGRLPPTGSMLQMTMGEGGFFSMATAYVAAYWFAVDGDGARPCAMRELPPQLWRRLVPVPLLR